MGGLTMQEHTKRAQAQCRVLVCHIRTSTVALPHITLHWLALPCTRRISRQLGRITDLRHVHVPARCGRALSDYITVATIVTLHTAAHRRTPPHRRRRGAVR